MANQFFSRDDVNEIRDYLTRLLRVTFYRLDITTDEFTRRHSDFWLRSNRPTREANGHLNNLRTAIINKRVTWQKFLHTVVDVLNLDITRLSITYKDKDGVEHTISSDEIV